jgi:hypothetical protein
MQAAPTFNVLNGNNIDGPYTAGQLRMLEQNGAINGDTPIARNGEAEWFPLHVWREVIHGAPTHRGAVPRLPKRNRAADSSRWSKVAMAAGVCGILLLAAGWIENVSSLWISGISLFLVALMVWVVAATRET